MEPALREAIMNAKNSLNTIRGVPGLRHRPKSYMVDGRRLLVATEYPLRQAQMAELLADIRDGTDTLGTGTPDGTVAQATFEMSRPAPYPAEHGNIYVVIDCWFPGNDGRVRSHSRTFKTQFRMDPQQLERIFRSRYPGSSAAHLCADAAWSANAPFIGYFEGCGYSGRSYAKIWHDPRMGPDELEVIHGMAEFVLCFDEYAECVQVECNARILDDRIRPLYGGKTYAMPVKVDACAGSRTWTETFIAEVAPSRAAELGAARAPIPQAGPY